MESLEIILGNKAYSSWSMRAWLALRQTGVTYREIVVPLFTAGYKERLLSYSPAGKVPVLKHGDRVIWDSLAICEYLAEQFPDAGLWPQNSSARALARSVSAEMHSGFNSIRQIMPFNCRATGRHIQSPSVELMAEIDRIQRLWQQCREHSENEGPWLFGHFSIADAMFIPVALRFATYGTALNAASMVYFKTVQLYLPVKEWIAAAEDESEVIEHCEIGRGM